MDSILLITTHQSTKVSIFHRLDSGRLYVVSIHIHSGTYWYQTILSIFEIILLIRVNVCNSYNYATPDDKYASVGDLLIQLIDSASQGGNLLLDMGPAATGRVPGPMVSRLQAMGSWIDSVGQESFFNTSIYWAAMTTTDLNNSTVRIRFLAGPDDSAFYIYSLDRPSEKLIIDVPVPIHSQSVITSGKQNTQLSWSHDTQGRLSITVPENVINDGQYVWLFKVDNSKV